MGKAHLCLVRAQIEQVFAQGHTLLLCLPVFHILCHRHTLFQGGGVECVLRKGNACLLRGQKLPVLLRRDLAVQLLQETDALSLGEACRFQLQIAKELPQIVFPHERGNVSLVGIYGDVQAFQGQKFFVLFQGQLQGLGLFFLLHIVKKTHDPLSFLPNGGYAETKIPRGAGEGIPAGSGMQTDRLTDIFFIIFPKGNKVNAAGTLGDCP